LASTSPVLRDFSTSDSHITFVLRAINLDMKCSGTHSINGINRVFFVHYSSLRIYRSQLQDTISIIFTLHYPYTVAYRPFQSGDCKQRPFLGLGSVNTFTLLGRRFLIIQQLDYNSGDTVFSMWSVPRCYKQGTKLIERQFCTGGCEDRSWACEAEESPLL
jgi:hypothetical protein